MNTPEDIDRLFRAETERLADIPPRTSFQKERFWQQLEYRLEPKKKSRSYLLEYGIAAGLLLLGMAVTLSWRIQEQQRELKNYAQELRQLKNEKRVAAPVHQVDTVFLLPDLTKETLPLPPPKPARTQPKSLSVPQVSQEPVIKMTLTVPDSATESTDRLATTRKPFRIVSKNHLPRPLKEIPDTEGMYVKAERQHTPKITISLTTKSDQ